MFRNILFTSKWLDIDVTDVQTTKHLKIIRIEHWLTFYNTDRARSIC